MLTRLSPLHREKWIGNIFLHNGLWALISQWDERSKVHEKQKTVNEVPWGQSVSPSCITGTCVDLDTVKKVKELSGNSCPRRTVDVLIGRG